MHISVPYEGTCAHTQEYVCRLRHCIWKHAQACIPNNVHKSTYNFTNNGKSLQGADANMHMSIYVTVTHALPTMHGE
jgi:hypothetical protein